MHVKGLSYIMVLVSCQTKWTLWIHNLCSLSAQMVVPPFHFISSSGKSSCYIFILINPFPNKPWFLHVCSTSLLKTLWEKEKLLVISNFSFSHSVSTSSENFLLSSSLNLKMSSANFSSLEESKICCLAKG